MSVKSFYNPYYSRNWQDIAIAPPLEGAKWAKYGKLAAEIGLPFLSFYQPARRAISVGVSLWNVVQKSYTYLTGGPKTLKDHIGLTKDVIELGATTIGSPSTNLLIANSFFDLCQQLLSLRDASPQARPEKLAECLSIALYIMSLADRSTPYWQIASLVVHAGLHFYKAYQVGQEARQTETYSHEKTLIIGAKALMGVIRLAQAYQTLQQHKNNQAFLAKQKADIEKLKLLLDEPLSEEEMAFLKTHPLSDLQKQIHSKKVLLSDPIKQKKIALGSYFHGYGGTLVKGAMLHFDEGTVHKTELTFKLTEAPKERLLERIRKIKSYDPEALDRLGISIDRIWERPNPFTTKPAIEVIHIRGKGALQITTATNQEAVQEGVTIALKDNPSIEKVYQFLKIFDLQDICKPSTSEDLEKIQNNFLHRSFYPGESYFLRASKEYMKLSPAAQRETLLRVNPGMKEIFEKYKVETTELLPGYLQCSTPLHQEAYARGARALTTALRYNTADDEAVFNIATNMLTNGIFSRELQQAAKWDIYDNSGSGHGTVFSQIIQKRDLDSEISTAYPADIRFYISLKALNRGSYQYNGDFLGTKSLDHYPVRKPILDFISDSDQLRPDHEVMSPLCFLPGDIQGMSVGSEQQREGIIDHFKKYGTIKKDGQGKETINGIPLKDFIWVGSKLTQQAADRCK